MKRNASDGGRIGTSMQGKKVYAKGYKSGKANCQRCKHFKYGYHCEKHNGIAYHPTKNKSCRYFNRKGE